MQHHHPLGRLALLSTLVTLFVGSPAGATWSIVAVDTETQEVAVSGALDGVSSQSVGTPALIL